MASLWSVSFHIPPYCIKKIGRNDKVEFSFLSECGAPELDGSIQGWQQAAALQVLPEAQNASAELAGGTPTSPQEVPQHEVTSLSFCADLFQD